MDPAAPDYSTDDVLAALAHKLGSPLGAIVNLAHLLGSGSRDAGQVAGDLAISARRASVLLAGARRWLEAMAVGAGTEPVDVGALARELGAAEQVECCAETLPAVRAAREAVRMMLVELLRNAREAVAPETAVLRLRGGTEGEWVRIDVGDDGPPWQGEEARRAFALFTSLASGSNGAGMGLPIISALARAQGGWAEPTTGAEDGARIRLLLPAVR